MRWLSAFILSATACVSAGASEEWFDRMEQALSFSAWNDTLRARLSGLLTLEYYQVEQPAPGMIFTTEDHLFRPRLGLQLQGQYGAQLFGFALVRFDRGFDPSNGDLRGRLEEYALTYVSPHESGINLKVGQFATVIGNWVARHDAWDNPFITAPLPYEHQTMIYDAEAPASPADFVHFEADEKYGYNPIIWGPSYATGAAVSGRLGHFEYAAEVKNTGPSSRPEVWPLRETGFDRPAYNARLGFRPDLRWSFGISASDSAFYLPHAENLPPGTDHHDYRQVLFGTDLGFAWHHLQVWAELFDCRFEVPRVGRVRTLAGYVETKYRFGATMYGALRWNRQTFSSIPDGSGSQLPWGNDVWRVDAAAGFRLSAHMEWKLQASGQNAPTGTGHVQANYSTQLNVRF